MNHTHPARRCSTRKPSARLGGHLTVLGLALALVCASSAALAQTNPWHLGKASIQESAPAAINTIGVAPGPNPVVVAVIDSGVLAEHPSLAGRLLPGYDMQSLPANLRGGRSANFAPDVLDARCTGRAASSSYRTHGTEVASLIAGNGHDGVLGVNPQAKILPIRLMGACGMTRKDMLDAIRWAAGLPVEGVPDNPHPARVINLSLAGGGATCNPALQELINQLAVRSIFVVAAAGNNFHKPLFEPANCQGVISVGAVDAKNRIEVYSALDPRTLMYAPGGGKQLDSSQSWGINKLRVGTFDLDFLGRERANALDRGVGTSFAAPVVAGFIALWLSHYPKKSPADFLAELPQFLREAESIEKCPTCKPRSLAVPSQLIKP